MLGTESGVAWRARRNSAPHAPVAAVADGGRVRRVRRETPLPASAGDRLSGVTGANPKSDLHRYVPAAREALLSNWIAERGRTRRPAGTGRARRRSATA